MSFQALIPAHTLLSEKIFFPLATRWRKARLSYSSYPSPIAVWYSVSSLFADGLMSKEKAYKFRLQRFQLTD